MTQNNSQREYTGFDLNWDWVTEDFDTPRPRITDDPALPVTLEDNLIPIDRNNGIYVPNHLDDHGTLHFFAAVDVSYEPDYSDLSRELHYFRVAQTDDGRLVHDSHPVMPLERGGASPFPLPALQIMLEDGDLDNAQELAHLTAQSHGLNFPDPSALPDLNTDVDYRFVGGSSDDGSPTLEAVKAWREGNQDREARITVARYGMSEELAVDLRELNELHETQGLEVAMNIAEAIAMAGGYLESTRDDPRLFADGPPDPFRTYPERERANVEITREHQDSEPDALAAETHVEQSREKLSNSQRRLLEPVDPAVNYSFEVVAADPWTLELSAEKWWIDEDGRIGTQAQTLKTYSMESYEWERETEREIASMDRDDLNRTYQENGLEAAMHQAEALAVANDELDPNRADGRMFQQGPPDRFTTLREAELVGLGAAPEPESWDALIAAQTDDEPEPERHYWQMHYRPVETPEGKPLGTALFVTEFPQLPPDFDDYIDKNGMEDSVYPTEARTLEMAHFANEKDAAKFDAEFRGYLVPGLLDGPELAPEVAKLEGLSGEWEEMDYGGIVDYMNGHRTVVRAESEWHLHDPNAERQTQEQFESMPAFDENEVPVPSVAPDLDL